MTRKEINRREFIRAAGAAGIGIATGGIAGAAETAKPQVAAGPIDGFAAPKLDTVRVAFIGVGARGSGHVAQMLMLDGVDIKAICDTHEPTARASAKRCVDKGRNEPAVVATLKDQYEDREG